MPRAIITRELRLGAAALRLGAAATLIAAPLHFMGETND
jgi:hypothetical protein